MAHTYIAFIGLGSNIHPRRNFLKLALSELTRQGRCEIVRKSSLYETKPLGDRAKTNFLNMVIELHTKLAPKELFLLLKEIERTLGRKPRERWADREIDLDILLVDDIVSIDETLTIPHPRITERDFVLVPLLEIDPEMVNPADGLAYKEIEAALTERFILTKSSESLSVR